MRYYIISGLTILNAANYYYCYREIYADTDTVPSRIVIKRSTRPK